MLEGSGNQLSHSFGTLSQSTDPSTYDKNNSIQLIKKIYTIIADEQNYKHGKQFKCNCKKSKCLKLYCECFSKGSYCKNCNCLDCKNLQEFVEIREKAQQEVLIKNSLQNGHKNSTLKSCTCTKTKCLKKYCECFSEGLKCSKYCHCINCKNTD